MIINSVSSKYSYPTYQPLYVCLLFLLASTLGCSKKGNSISTPIPVAPTLVTTTALATNATTDSCSGYIYSNGGASITSFGVVWSTSHNPTVDLSTIASYTYWNGVSSFSINISNLTASTTYYIRSYATNSAGTGYGSEASLTTPMAIGQSLGGGIVAYTLVYGDAGYDPNVPHGLIVAPSDQSSGVSWSNGSFIFTGTYGIAIGTGSANTDSIVAAQGAGSYAASLCKNLNLGGYSDWFLPSRYELDAIYNNRATIGAGFAPSNYWSSSEIPYPGYGTPNPQSNTYQTDFNYGGSTTANKSNSYHVRAIRAF